MKVKFAKTAAQLKAEMLRVIEDQMNHDPCKLNTFILKGLSDYDLEKVHRFVASFDTHAIVEEIPGTEED